MMQMGSFLWAYFRSSLGFLPGFGFVVFSLDCYRALGRAPTMQMGSFSGRASDLRKNGFGKKIGRITVVGGPASFSCERFTQ
jgi:hypothetical protein